MGAGGGVTMIRPFAVLMALIGSASIAAARDLTDAEAKQIAVDMEQSVSATRASLNGLIKAGDKRSYNRTMGPLLAKMSNWPEMHLGHRAIFPYFYCRDAGSAVMMYGDAWYRGDPSETWRSYAVDKFRRWHAECKRSLVEPDMSLKNIK